MTNMTETPDVPESLEPDSLIDPTPAEPAPPIQSRFLFVDVAALRAKQLRRGARARFDVEPPAPHKLERIAMEEVRRGLVYYEVRAKFPAANEGQA
jgi:DNA-directed RNA polymerase omega subunit